MKTRFAVIAFVVIQAVIPATLLVERVTEQGWEPKTALRYSWQMYSVCTGVCK